MTLPQDSINLEGILLQRFKEIGGSPESSLNISNNPVIFRPFKAFDLLAKERPKFSETSSNKKFVFRQVNFTSKNLEALFVLQNMESDISLLFEDCHFLNKR